MIYEVSDINKFIKKQRHMIAEKRNARKLPPTHFATIFFGWKENKLTPEGTDIIRRAATQAKLLGYISIEVTGHSDTSGQPEPNYELSLSRAQVVANELVGNGLPANRLEIRGYGDTKLRVPTAAGVREPSNRRVEITIRLKERSSTRTRSSGPSRWWGTIAPPPLRPPPPPPPTSSNGLYEGIMSQAAPTLTIAALVGGSNESDMPVTLGRVTPAKDGDQQLSWCFWSTSESVRNEVLSVTAILETALAVLLYWWVALEVGIFTPLLVSAAAAPLVLLRSDRSVELGLQVFAKFSRNWFLSHSPGPNRIPLEIALTALLLTIITAAGMIGTEALDMSKMAYISATLLSLGVLVLVGIFSVMVSFILVSWMGAPRQSLSLLTTRAASSNNWRAVFLIPLLGIGFAIYVVSVGIRVVATFAHFRAGLIELPRNFRRLTFCTSPAHVPELMPGEANNTKKSTHHFDSTFTFDSLISSLTKQTRSDVAAVAFTILVMIICFVPPWLYRITIKSTTWFWWPLAFLGDDLRRARDPRRFHLKIWGTLWAKASVGMAALTLGGFGFSNFLLTPGVLERNPLLTPIGYFFLFDWTVDPWQVCALVAAVLSVMIVFGVDDAVGELANAQTNDNEGLHKRKVAATKLGWWERVARLRLLFLLAFWLMVGAQATLVVNSQKCWFTLPAVAQAWAIKMYGVRFPKSSCIEG
jgi:outer membrane protein OmpA-like peptidoglycan-associated protein